MEYDLLRHRLVDEEEVNADLDARIRSALVACFPEAAAFFARSRAWHGSSPAWTVIAEDRDGTIAGHVGIVDRTIRVGTEQLRVGGIQNVCVLPAWRGWGLSLGMLDSAAAIMRGEGLDAGLLFCVPDLVGVYERSAWQTLKDTAVTRVDEDGMEVPLPAGSVAMWLPRRRADWPEGDVHLGGNDW